MMFQNYSIFTFLSFFGSMIAVVFSNSTDKSDSELLNTTHAAAVITISIRSKLNGNSIGSNTVPIKSRVTIYCKVSLRKDQQKLLNLMLVSFTLPGGDQVVPRTCAVNTKHNCKRCKLVMKSVTLSHQGKYRCHAHYISEGKLMKRHGDFFLYLKKDLCSSSKMFCRSSKKCVTSLQQCERNLNDSERNIQDLSTRCSSAQFECHNGQCLKKQDVCNGVIDCLDNSDEISCEVHKRSMTQVNPSKANRKLMSTGYVLSVTGMLVILAFIVVVLLWIKRKRSRLMIDNENKMIARF